MTTDIRPAVITVLAASLGLAPAPAEGAPMAQAPQLAKVDAPTAPDTVDPKAKAIHDRAVESLRKLKALELTSVLAVEGIDPSMIPPGITDPAHVVIEFQSDKPGSPMPFSRLALDSAKDGKSTAKFCFDGKSAIVVDEATKSYMQCGEQEWPMLLGQRTANLPQWHFENRMDMAGMPADSMPKDVAFTVVGEETLDGQPCDVVRRVRTMQLEGMQDDSGKPVAGPELRITEVVAFARQDGLPRRVQSRTEMKGDDSMPAMTTVVTYTGVKVDPALTDASFATAAPAGYKKAESPAEDKGPEMKVKAGDAAPDFKLTDFAGKEWTLGSLKGQVVLLDFWALWCGPCKRAMPAIQKIHEDYKSKGVTVLGVNTWERDADGAKKFLETKGFTYPSLTKGDDLAGSYGMSGIPTLVVIGKDGKIAMIEVGLGPDGDTKLRSAIDAALAAK
jgi:thiol-disulfide isomerase/thioredoxin